MFAKQFLSSIIALTLNCKVTGQTTRPADLGGICPTSFESNTGSTIITYSIGDMILTDTWINSGLMISQGILQPVNNSVTGLPSFTLSELTVYPNPVSNLIFIHSAINQSGKYSFSVLDVNGKLLRVLNKFLPAGITESIDLSSLATGVYFLKVEYQAVTGNRKSGIYKIIKTY